MLNKMGGVIDGGVLRVEQGGHSALSILWAAWRLRGDDDISWGRVGYILPSSFTHSSLTHPVSPTVTHHTTRTMIPSYLPPRGSSLPPHPHFDVAWFPSYLNRGLLPHGESPAPVERYIYKSISFPPPTSPPPTSPPTSIRLKLCVEQSIPSGSALSSYHSTFQPK